MFFFNCKLWPFALLNVHTENVSTLGASFCVIICFFWSDISFFSLGNSRELWSTNVILIWIYQWTIKTEKWFIHTNLMSDNLFYEWVHNIIDDVITETQGYWKLTFKRLQRLITLIIFMNRFYFCISYRLAYVAFILKSINVISTQFFFSYNIPKQTKIPFAYCIHQEQLEDYHVHCIQPYCL